MTQILQATAQAGNGLQVVAWTQAHTLGFLTDGESRVEINCNNLSQESILIVQSTNKDEYIIELILIIDALKRLGANQFLLDL